jgi:hypothetical protein
MSNNIRVRIWQVAMIEQVNLMDEMINKIITNSHKSVKEIWKLNLKNIKHLKACFICLHNLDIVGCEEFIKKYKKTELKIFEIYDENKIAKTFVYTADKVSWSTHEKEGAYIKDADVCKINLEILEDHLAEARRLLKNRQN